MRKLLLFGLLGGVFGVALLLERLFSQPEPQAALAANKAVWVLGGGTPREIPEEPPAEESSRKGSSPARIGGKKTATPVAADAEIDAAPAPIDLEEETTPVRHHIVAADETLSSIARLELGSTTRWKDLARWNGITDPAALKKGTKLRLAPPQAATAEPAPRSSPSAVTDAPALARTHKVAKGETLSKISARYLGSAQRWREIQRLNGNVDPANVAEGTVLRIPER